MSASEREHARQMLLSAERYVDNAMRLVDGIRALFAPARRALQR